MRSRPLIVAHRGAAVTAPENTIDAFEAAIELGADMIEFDVRRTMDNELVVFHDEAFDGRLLSTLPAEALARTDLPAGSRVPRLSELLEAVRGRTRLDIELKEGGYETRVLDLVFEHGFSATDFVVTTFEAASIERIKSARLDVRTGLLVYDMSPRQALDAFRNSRADFLGPDVKIVDDWMLRTARADGVEFLPWTVNEPADLRRLLIAPAVMGIITDRTADAVRIRAEGLITR